MPASASVQRRFEAGEAARDGPEGQPGHPCSRQPQYDCGATPPSCRRRRRRRDDDGYVCDVCGASSASSSCRCLSRHQNDVHRKLPEPEVGSQAEVGSQDNQGSQGNQARMEPAELPEPCFQPLLAASLSSLELAVEVLELVVGSLGSLGSLGRMGSLGSLVGSLVALLWCWQCFCPRKVGLAPGVVLWWWLRLWLRTA